jgi:hypothetical protein
MTNSRSNCRLSQTAHKKPNICRYRSKHARSAPKLAPKMIGIVHTPQAEYDEP